MQTGGDVIGEGIGYVFRVGHDADAGDDATLCERLDGAIDGLGQTIIIGSKGDHDLRV